MLLRLILKHGWSEQYGVLYERSQRPKAIWARYFDHKILVDVQYMYSKQQYFLLVKIETMISILTSSIYINLYALSLCMNLI